MWALTMCAAALLTQGAAARESAGIRVVEFQLERPMCRAARPTGITAVLENSGESAVTAEATLIVPTGIRVLAGPVEQSVRLDGMGRSRIRWSVQAAEAGERELALRVRLGGAESTATLTADFLPAVPVRKLDYVAEPRPVHTQLLIGAHDCPLWETDKPEMWAQIRKHTERTPALGFYGQENPQVADWETLWAAEHGIGFFIYCWYRSGQGGPVKMNFGSAIHDALLKSRYRSHIKFTIMWENQNRGTAGVSDEKDLMQNLLPFWMEKYFKRPEYLKVDNKPVLFIYRPEFLVQDLGSVEAVNRAFGKMRDACKAAGFDGLYLLGEYRGLDPNQLRLMKQLGLDYTFAYVWYVGNSPAPQEAIRAQMSNIRQTQEFNIIPQVVTVSEGWSGWADEGSIWRLPPKDWEDLLRQAKDYVGTLPRTELGGRMLLLDNWNEWGEGHYIAPHRQYGFGYLDAVRRVFADSDTPHSDLLPEDIGLGPYDSAYRKGMAEEERLRALRIRKAAKPGSEEPGLIGWWAFDDKSGSPVAADYSGHRLGGVIHSAKLAPGIDSGALVCDGGCVLVDSAPALSPADVLTVECWVKTDVAGQGNNWLVNRVFSGGINTGYRLGILDGCPCFEVPLTDWSHHLKADVPLPTGRWVHLAGTFDGKVMRIYVDGVEHGTMERPGPIHANDFHLCLGSFEIGHAAHFTGLLDEVRLYNRALTPAEIHEHYQRLAARAGR